VQPQTLNRYAYALNNPVNRTDPAGLASEGGGGGLANELLEELVFQDCVKLVLVTVLLVALAGAFFALPSTLVVGGLAATLFAGISTFNALVTAGAAAGVGYAATDLCSERIA
jgi:hypothetical protein